MKILAPIDQSDDPRRLIESRADELYFGFLPESHVERYSPLYSLNRRAFVDCNFSDWGKALDVVKQVLDAGKRIFCVFNSAFYLTSEYSTILDMIQRLEQAGVSGFILSDVGLMAHVRESGVNCFLGTGVDTGIMNSGAVMFLREAFNIERVILDRSLSLEDVAAIISDGPKIEYEVIVKNAPCKHIDAFCGHLHGMNSAGEIDRFYKRMIPCWWPYTATTRTAADPGRGEELRLWLERTSRTQHGGCAACSLKELKRAGITHLKIAGRGHSPESKLADIQFISAAVELANACPDSEFGPEVRKLRARILGSPCRWEECYYEVERNGAD